MLLNAGKYFITNQSLNHLICYNYLSNQQLEVIAIELYHFGTLFMTWFLARFDLEILPYGTPFSYLVLIKYIY